MSANKTNNSNANHAKSKVAQIIFKNSVHTAKKTNTSQLPRSIA